MPSAHKLPLPDAGLGTALYSASMWVTNISLNLPFWPPLELQNLVLLWFLCYLKYKIASFLLYCNFFFLFSVVKKLQAWSFPLVVSSACCLKINFLSLEAFGLLLSVWLVWLHLREILIFLKVNVGMWFFFFFFVGLRFWSAVSSIQFKSVYQHFQK